MNCYICGQSTSQQPTVVIENKTRYIHKACFRCSICGSRLEGYLIRNDALCCVDCLQTKMINEKCGKCGDIIHGKKTKVKNSKTSEQSDYQYSYKWHIVKVH